MGELERTINQIVKQHENAKKVIINLIDALFDQLLDLQGNDEMQNELMTGLLRFLNQFKDSGLLPYGIAPKDFVLWFFRVYGCLTITKIKRGTYFYTLHCKNPARVKELLHRSDIFDLCHFNINSL